MQRHEYSIICDWGIRVSFRLEEGRTNFVISILPSNRDLGKEKCLGILLDKNMVEQTLIELDSPK